jgi:hypothetical protein
MAGNKSTAAIYNTDTEAEEAMKEARRLRRKKDRSRLFYNTRLECFRPCYRLVILFVALLMALLSLDVAAQDADPGDTNPIVPCLPGRPMPMIC